MTTPSGTLLVIPAIAHDLRTGADVDMVAQAGLAAHDDVVAGRRAAGDADLGANQIVLADAAVVGDLNQVVDFGAFADRGRAVGAAVDRGAGADFDVVVDANVAQLGGQDMSPGDVRVAEAVSADHCAAVNDHAVADDRVFVEHRAGTDEHVASDFAAGQNLCAGQNCGAVADDAIVADGCAGVNVYVFAATSR